VRRSYSQRIRDELEIRRREREAASADHESRLDRRDFWVKLALETVVAAGLTAAWLLR